MTLTANEIRKKFLDFFESKGHTIVPSDSVVPKDDPTVLFTTAGMQQFKRQFLGQGVTYKRAATSQKCLRTDDLDKVGITPFHHTFFEMLGNFSFGDYFKKDAIAWGWEFLTTELRIPKDKLWVSVYEEDDEAYDIWLKDIKIPKERIVKLGDKSNFWPSEAKAKGPNGPCGPCSEIFYDYGVNKNCPNGKKCDPDCSCGRFSEVWNLVFTQFNRKDGGAFEPLPGKNIDTGMGFERLVAVVQGKKSNYESDLFVPLISQVEQFFTQKKCKLDDTEKHVIADHLRAITFGISDGVMPSNEGRGYVIKKLIVDSADIGLKKELTEPFICRFVSVVADIMREPYPELVRKQNDISVIIQKVEEAYLKVRNERIPKLEEEFLNLARNSKTFYEDLGEIIFRYHDTFGLTFETISNTASILKMKLEEWQKATTHYKKTMEQQKERSRASSKMTGDVFTDAELNLNVPKTEFLGYKNIFKSSAKVLKIFVNNKEVDSVKENDAVKIVLDKTPFYAESGGQVGDTGTISKDNNIVRIIDTKKIADVFIHFGQVEKGSLKVNDGVEAYIDEKRRLSIMQNHTATHLLQAALREVLGKHVQQQGSLVAEDRLRFDFTHPQGVNKDQLNKIELIIEGYINANDKIDTKPMPLEDAKKIGALAFFAEKYGATVRVVEIDGYSKEFCGGTHLENTGEIIAFKIAGEGAVAQGIRRIEARTGNAALKFIEEQEKQEKERLEREAIRIREKANEQQKDKEVILSLKASLPAIIDSANTINNTKIIMYTFENPNTVQLKYACDIIKQQAPSMVACLASTSSIGIVVSSSTSHISANDVITAIKPVFGGKGGGNPQLAQVVGNDLSKLGLAMEKAKEIIEGKLK